MKSDLGDILNILATIGTIIVILSNFWTCLLIFIGIIGLAILAGKI